MTILLLKKSLLYGIVLKTNQDQITDAEWYIINCAGPFVKPIVLRMILKKIAPASSLYDSLLYRVKSLSVENHWGSRNECDMKQLIG